MDLSTLYPKTAAAQDLEKNAEAELFCKLAAQNGIDLTKLNDEEVTALYNFTFTKAAEDESEEKDEKEEEEKKEAASREHQQKLAFAKEAQQADELGRRMAHSYVDELNKIGSALQAQAAQVAQGDSEESKEAGIKDIAAKGKEGLKRGVEHVQAAFSKKHGPATPPVHGPKTKFQDTIQRGSDAVKEHKKTIGIGAGAAAAGAGAGYVAGRKKESSALDQMALEAAVKIAHDGGLDPEEAAARVMAVHTLGLDESTKVASTLDQQVEIRALEFLEAAGYPVTWEQ